MDGCCTLRASAMVEPPSLTKRPTAMERCFDMDAIVLVVFGNLDIYSANRLRMGLKRFYENTMWMDAIFERGLNGARVRKWMVRNVLYGYFKQPALCERVEAHKAAFGLFHTVYAHCMYTLVDAADHSNLSLADIRRFIVDLIVQANLEQSMHKRQAVVDRFRLERPIALGMIARAEKSVLFSDSKYRNPERLAALKNAVRAFPESVEDMVEGMMRTCFTLSASGVVGFVIEI